MSQPIAAVKTVESVIAGSPGLTNDDWSSSTTHQHEIEHLVEANMGSELTTSTIDFVDLHAGSLDTAIDRLVNTSPFQDLEKIVEKCYSENFDASNKRTKPEDPPKVTSTSFSLFDMLDRQNVAFTVPPRITATQVIEAHQREKRDVRGQTLDLGLTAECQSSLELLEKADNIEDLSPDPDTWEQVRQILYTGLVTSTRRIGIRSRYFQVHKSLLDICWRESERGNNQTQSWDLLQNLVGSVLILSDDILKAFYGDMSDIPLTNEYMNFYWDLIQHLLASLTHIALNYITTCAGDEKQIERMIMGMCFILAHDCATILTAAMDPLAGWFEVWARFIPPKRMAAIIQCSGLGGSALLKCRRSATSDVARKLVDELNRCGCIEFITTADIELAVHFQSLSILRSILYQCGSSKFVVVMLFQQFTNRDKLSTEKGNHLSNFLTQNGIVCTNTVQEILDELQICVDGPIAHGISELSNAVDAVFEPFQDALASNELHLLPHIEWACNSSLEIYAKLK